jgi:hypothetical protein
MQLALAAGCSSSAAADDLFTSTSPSAESQSSAESQGGHVESLPARVSRAFFEKPLLGVLRIGDQATISRVTWEEYPPTDSPPTGPVIADLRNHMGCAVYEDAGGAKLCFTIIPDVSSVSLDGNAINAEELCGGGSFQGSRVLSSRASRQALAVLVQAVCDGQPTTIEMGLDSPH